MTHVHSHFSYHMRFVLGSVLFFVMLLGIASAQTTGDFSGEAGEDEFIEDIDAGLEIADIESTELEIDGYIYEGDPSEVERTAERLRAELQFLQENELGVSSGVASCFDYYSFNSVQAFLVASVESTVSGVPVEFSGELVNENSYPIVDGSLYVKVFKERDVDDANGPDVVDQFFAVSDVSIPAGGSTPISFMWNVPSHAQSGEYELATFFVTARKFNLLGLPFTDDVIGNTVSFTVAGERDDGVAFDKASVTVNGEPYEFAAFPPNASANEPVSLAARVANTTEREQEVILTWTVYYWDSLLRRNAVQEESQRVSIPANSSAPVSVTITDTQFPVYAVVGAFEWEDTKSIIGPRFAREGVARLRINFPGITAFPLVRGEEAAVFSCLHNTADTVISDGRLDLTLLDAEGDLIHRYSYEGAVGGDMIGVVDRFVPSKMYDNFVLEARLYEGDVFVDEARAEYFCEDIDSSLCGSGRALNGLFATAFDSSKLIIVLAVVLLLLGFGVRRWFGEEDQQPLESEDATSAGDTSPRQQ